jgi:putative Holliday junction resolvase
MDVGDKRIGMAVSDCMGCTAQGIQTLERQTKHIDRVKVQNIIEKYNPEKIVIGLPKNMNGSIGPQAKKVQAFGEGLKTIYKGDIIYWDERLTTVSAHRAMIAGSVRRKTRKQKVDQIAAILILQSYLDFFNNQRKKVDNYGNRDQHY